MTSAFQAQLRTIAANSVNELDLRARRDAHAESLIFERSVAAKQDWETIYQICREGFQELCLLDSRLREFEQNLYSPQAKDQDREQLNKSQNEALGVVLDRCLALLGSKLLLRPGVRAVEWLVRRFRIHVYNTGALLATFLPYHETPIFRNVLSIIPANKIVSEWKFLGPYHKDMVNVPRHAIVYSATHNDAFFSVFNQYTLRVCHENTEHVQLLRFWSSVATEAITGRLKQVKSGRKEVQRQRTEDALFKILPVLIEGFDIKDCPELTVACFTICLVLAGNADLQDQVIDTLMSAIAPFMINGEADAKSALACVAILAAKKQDKRLPKNVLDIFSKAVNLTSDLVELRGPVPLAPLYESLVVSALSSLKQKNLDVRLRLLERVFDVSRGLFEPATKSQLLAVVLKKLQPNNDKKPPEPALRAQLVQLLQRLNDSQDFSTSFGGAASLAGLTQSEAEELLQGTIESPPQSGLLDLVPMDDDGRDDGAVSEVEAAEAMLGSLPPRSTELSFLTIKRSSLFDQLAQTFRHCRQNETLMERFEELPIWRQQTENPSDLHTSFLLRMAFASSAVADRHDSLQLLAKTLRKRSRDHTQLLIPFLTVLLCDPAQSVRRAAVACIIAIHGCVSEAKNEENADTDSVYDALSLKNVKCISPAQAHKLLDQIYMPFSEECILDPSRIRKLVQASLGGSTQNVLPSGADIELKKPQKHGLFELLTGCALSCPLLKVRTVVIQLLDGIHKVGTISVSKTLSPILQDWASLSESEAQNVAVTEGLSRTEIDGVMVQLVMAQDKGAVENILTMLVEGQVLPRDALVATFFDRISTIWKSIGQEAQRSAAVRLFDISFSDKSAQNSGSRHVLHSIDLSTDILAAILDHALSGLTEMPTSVPPRKRRRTSQGRESIPQDVAVKLDGSEARLTFALELVEDSKPETHPQLIASLFEVLVILRRLKAKNNSESPYLLNLCLSSILAITAAAQQARKSNVDLSSIRADLVTDCVRSSENPQVQSTALLLCASLASLAPDRILHTIMPIFTFMGKSILSKDDERSVYVTNRAIDEIIPPLVASLKKQDARNLFHSTSSLLSSFVTAYDHIPQHRRVAFYQRLVDRLGVDDFSFAVIALLASRKRSEDMSPFCTDLIANTSTASQLTTFRKILDLTTDAFASNPHIAEPLLDITKTTSTNDKEQIASVLLEVAAKLLGSRSLKSQIKRLAKSDEAAKDAFWSEFKASISRVLSMLKSQKTQHNSLTPETKKCLNGLLELPSLADLLDIMPQLLEELSQVEETRDLQPLALRVLASQLHATASSSKDSNAPSAAISFLPTLESIVRDTIDESFRHAAIQCIDRIVEIYGRKSPDEAIAAISVLFEDGAHGLESADERTQVMSLLCVASGMEVVKEGGVPIVLGAMPKIFPLLTSTLDGGAPKPELHDACYSVLSSFISHVPFMISDENVTEIFAKSYQSCSAMREFGSCTEARTDTLGLMARKLSLATLTSSLGQVFEETHSTSTMNADAVLELLDMLSQAIEYNSKSTVVKSAEQISSDILQILDLRRLVLLGGVSGNNGDLDSAPPRLSEESITTIESKLHALGITFIYKLADTSFRPIFEGWVDWASSSSSSSIDQSTVDLAHHARMASFISFARHFFESLKSIVTSYASYVLPLINDVLRHAIGKVSSTTATATATNDATTTLLPPSSSATITTSESLDLSNPTPLQLQLYQTTLSLLTTIATHDADGFLTSPSHFQPLAMLLISQLHLVGRAAKSIRRALVHETLLPALVSLASAVQDVPALHHTLNHLLCQLRRSDAAAVRLASIQAHMALTQAGEGLGDEWVQNVVMGQASALATASDADEDDHDGRSAAVAAVGGAGETMVYVNEMLEDDDEDVEMSVRKWVRMVREMVGEDVFET